MRSTKENIILVVFFICIASSFGLRGASVFPRIKAASLNQKITVTSSAVKSNETTNQIVTFTKEVTTEEKVLYQTSYDLRFLRMGRDNKSALISPNNDSKFETFLETDIVSSSYNNQTYQIDAQTVEWGNSYVGATAAHNNVPPIIGNNMVVAVIDTGVQLDHPDLVGRIKAGGYDYINNDSDPSDDNGHGTHIAGIIAANDNLINIVGVAPGAQIMPFKACNASGVCDSLAIADSIDEAVIQGVEIINMSLGGSANELVQAAVNRATTAGIIVVASSGNTNSPSCLYPAAYSNVVCVGAIDSSDVRGSFSNYGLGLDVVAPGVNIRSLGLAGGSATMSGTSMAAAYYSGVAALIRGIQEDICISNPAASMCSDIRGYTQFFINYILIRDLGDYGYDSQFGGGAIDIGQLFLKTSIAYSNLPSNVNQGTAYLQTIHLTNNNAFDISLNSCKVRGDNVSFMQTQPFWNTGWLVVSGAAYKLSSTSLFESRYTMSTPYTITAGATVRFDYSATPSLENRSGDSINYMFTCKYDNSATAESELYVLNPMLNSTIVQQPDPLDSVYFTFNTLRENDVVFPSQLYNSWDVLTFHNYDPSKMRLIGIYTLDHDANDLRAAIYSSASSSSFNVKTSYLVPSNHSFAYVATVENIDTGRYAYKFFNFSTK